MRFAGVLAGLVRCYVTAAASLVYEVMEVIVVVRVY
jgi:hypothetical protein